MMHEKGEIQVVCWKFGEMWRPLGSGVNESYLDFDTP